VGRHLRSARHRALVTEIVAARKATGLSQREFAKKLKRSNNFVWRIEAGERQVNSLELWSICEAAGVPYDEFIRRLMRRA
jgi:transcriptional regulator with XRE-family HTH domain